ncbi:MAG: hypothetical protein U0984_05100 [Prosthecobacter sp.]|nr:hypothetical protein [Prosthecobacter sp.]
MQPLKNLRHELFARAIAAGHSPELAYQQAGFLPKSHHARAEALCEDPQILARLAQLEAEDDAAVEQGSEHPGHRWTSRVKPLPPPRPRPTTQTEMLDWFWQIIEGRGCVLDCQVRAAVFFTKMNGWDKPAPKPPSAAKPCDQPAADPEAELKTIPEAAAAAPAPSLAKPSASTKDTSSHPSDLSSVAAPAKDDPSDPSHLSSVAVPAKDDPDTRSSAPESRASVLECSSPLELSPSPATPPHTSETAPSQPPTTHSSEATPTPPKKLTYLQELVLGLHNSPPGNTMALES